MTAVEVSPAHSECQVKFRKGFLNTVKSDTGFRVKIRAIQGFVEYREGKRRATIPVHNDFSKGRGYLHKNTIIEWNRPYENEIISEEKRKEILQNVFEAMRFRSYPVELI